MNPQKSRNNWPVGCFLFVCLGCWGYLGAVWVATRTVRLHAPLGTSPKTLQLPKMPTLESSFHLHEKTGCRFSYEWWLNPRYPSKPNKSCIRYSMFCIFYLSFQPPTRSVSIIFRAQHDASLKHFEGSPNCHTDPSHPRDK